MSNLIETQNLTNLRRHIKGISALSEMMQETSLPMVVNKMLYLDEKSDPIDIMTAFEHDLGSTAQMLKNTAIAMTSLNEKGVSAELSVSADVIFDFNEMFPKHYDNKTQTLSLFGLDISAKNRDLAADDWKRRLYQNMITGSEHGKDYDEYRKHLSLLKNLESTARPSDNSAVHELLHYGVMLSKVEQNQGFYQTLLSLAKKYIDFRKDLSEKNRDLLDDRIVGSRAMIDGVVKSSTYLAPGEILQLSSKHKENIDVVNKIVELMKITPCVSHIEIDQDADVIKVHDTLVDINAMSLDVPDAFIFKVRRLGNYGLCGISAYVDADQTETLVRQYGFSSNQLRIVAVDVEYPTSIAHEIVHFRDQNQADPIRNAFIKHFAKKMDIGALEEIVSQHSRLGTSYFTKPMEILARLGEIGFLLNQHDYKAGETVEEFSDRVKNGELKEELKHGKLRYQVNLVKPIETYLGEKGVFHKQIYFNFSDWAPDELSMVRDYTREFFYKPDPEIRKSLELRIARGEFSTMEMVYRKSKQKSRRKTRPLRDDEKLNYVVAKMEPGELVMAYQKLLSQNLLQDGELPLHLLRAQMRMFDGGSAKSAIKAPHPIKEKQFEEMCNLARETILQNRPYDQFSALWVLERTLNLDLSRFIAKPEQAKAFGYNGHTKTYGTFIASTKMLTCMNFTENLESGTNPDYFGVRLPENKATWITTSWAPEFAQKITQNLVDAIVELEESVNKYEISADFIEQAPDTLKLPLLVRENLFLPTVKESEKNTAEYIRKEYGTQSFGLLKNEETIINLIQSLKLWEMFDPEKVLTALLIKDKNALLCLAKDIVNSDKLSNHITTHEEEIRAQLDSADKKVDIRQGLLSQVDNDIKLLGNKRTPGYDTIDPIKRLCSNILAGNKDVENDLYEATYQAIKNGPARDIIQVSCSNYVEQNWSFVARANVVMQLIQPIAKVTRGLLTETRDNAVMASDFAVKIMCEALSKHILRKASSQQLGFNNYHDHKYYTNLTNTISQNVIDVANNFNSVSAQENRTDPQSQKIEAILDESKAVLQNWLAMLDNIAPTLSSHILKYIQHRTFRPDEDVGFGPEASRLNSIIIKNTEKILLPLAFSGKLFSPTQEIINQVKATLVSEDPLPETQPTPEPSPKPQEEIDVDVNLVDLDDIAATKTQKDDAENRSAYFNIINEGIKPADNGVLTKRQQMKLF